MVRKSNFTESKLLLDNFSQDWKIWSCETYMIGQKIESMQKVCLLIFSRNKISNSYFRVCDKNVKWQSGHLIKLLFKRKKLFNHLIRLLFNTLVIWLKCKHAKKYFWSCDTLVRWSKVFKSLEKDSFLWKKLQMLGIL